MSEVIQRAVLRSTQGGWRIYTLEHKGNRYYLYCQAGNSYEQAANGTKLGMGSDKSKATATSWFQSRLSTAKDHRLVTNQLSGLEELALMMVEEEHDD